MGVEKHKTFNNDTVNGSARAVAIVSLFLLLFLEPPVGPEALVVVVSDKAFVVRWMISNRPRPPHRAKNIEYVQHIDNNISDLHGSITD